MLSPFFLNSFTVSLRLMEGGRSGGQTDNCGVGVGGAGYQSSVREVNLKDGKVDLLYPLLSQTSNVKTLNF